MPKTKVRKGQKPRPSAGPLPPRPRVEFSVEGELTVSCNGGAPSFVIDDSHLSELAIFHFKPPIDDEGIRRFGRVKILIVPIHE